MRQKINQIVTVLRDLAAEYPAHARTIQNLLPIINQLPAEVDRLQKAGDDARQALGPLKAELEQAQVTARNWQQTAEMRTKKIAELEGVLGDRDRVIGVLRQKRLAEHEGEVNEMQAEISRLNAALQAEIARSGQLNLQIQNLTLTLKDREAGVKPLEDGLRLSEKQNQALREQLKKQAEQLRQSALTTEQLLGAAR